jgi:hypothetical protein
MITTRSTCSTSTCSTSASTGAGSGTIPASDIQPTFSPVAESKTHVACAGAGCSASRAIIRAVSAAKRSARSAALRARRSASSASVIFTALGARSRAAQVPGAGRAAARASRSRRSFSVWAMASTTFAGYRRVGRCRRVRRHFLHVTSSSFENRARPSCFISYSSAVTVCTPQRAHE